MRRRPESGCLTHGCLLARFHPPVLPGGLPRSSIVTTEVALTWLRLEAGRGMSYILRLRSEVDDLTDRRMLLARRDGGSEIVVIDCPPRKTSLVDIPYGDSDASRRDRLGVSMMRQTSRFGCLASFVQATSISMNLGALISAPRLRATWHRRRLGRGTRVPRGRFRYISEAFGESAGDPDGQTSSQHEEGCEKRLPGDVDP